MPSGTKQFWGVETVSQHRKLAAETGAELVLGEGGRAEKRGWPCYLVGSVQGRPAQLRMPRSISRGLSLCFHSGSHVTSDSLWAPGESGASF